MKPNELYIQGLAAFREAQTIDFRSLEDLFVIIGPTGAGKSTILDAISFALFGELPRANNHQRKDFITLGAPEANVRLLFEVNGAEYEVARKLSRKKAQVATLHRVEGADRVAVADGIDDVNQRIKGILGFDFDAFTKAVLLPQGDFAAFLRGKTEERRTLLAGLLDAEKYVRAGKLARERAEKADHEIAVLKQTLSADWSDATEEQKQVLENQARDLRAKEEELRSAQAGVADAIARAETLRREEAASRQLEDVFNAAGRELESLAVIADSLMEEAERTEGDLAQAIKVSADARAELDAAEAALVRAIQESGDEPALARLATAAEQAIEAERELATLADRRKEADRELADAEAALATSVEAQRAAGQNEAVAAAAYEEARVRVATVNASARAMAERRTADEALRRAREEVKTLAEQATKARDALARATAVTEDAERHLADIRVGHEAQALRQVLKAGEACPVCTQVVSVLPPPGPGHDALQAAEEIAKSARAERKSAEKAEREASLKAARAETMAEEAEARLAVLPAAVDIAGDAVEDAESAATEAKAALETAIAARRTADTSATARSAALVRAQSSVEEHVRQRDTLEQRRERSLEVLTSRFEALSPSDAAARIGEDQERLRALRSSAATLRAVCDASAKAEAMARAARAEYESQARRTRDELIAIRARVDDAPAAAESLSDSRTIRELLQRVTLRAAELGTRASDAAAAAGQAEADAVARTGPLGLSDVRGEGTAAVLEALARAIRSAGERAAQSEAAVEATAKRIALRAEHETAIVERQQTADQYRRLSNELRADRFIKFVLEESFQDLADRASDELRRVSSGRYSLKANGYDFEVVDHANADERRSVVTLSGGESFLASLSLALAFAGSIRDIAGDALGSRLESVFIDEGFGSLDPDVLDIVADGLERVQEDRRRVGIITHVPALAARIPSGLRVEQVEGGSRVVLRT